MLFNHSETAYISIEVVEAEVFENDPFLNTLKIMHLDKIKIMGYFNIIRKSHSSRQL